MIPEIQSTLVLDALTKLTFGYSYRHLGNGFGYVNSLTALWSNQ